MNILEVVKVGLEILAPLGVIKWADNRYKHYKKNREQVAILQKHITEGILQQLKDISYQLYPNGGNNLIGKVEKSHMAIENVINGLRVTREILEIANWESDSEGRVYYVSSALCELIGCTPNDALDRSWIGRVSLEDRDRVFKEWMASVQTASEFECEYSYRKSDGMYQKVKAVAMHTKDENGKVFNTLGRLVKIGEPYYKK